MKNRFIYSCSAALAVIAATATITQGCGKKSSTTTPPPAAVVAATPLPENAEIKIAGKLSLTGTSTQLNLLDDAPALSTLSVYCVTFSNPPVAGTGAVAADGSFSLTLAGAQQAIGCFILQGDSQLGTIVFEDSTKKSIGGQSKTDSRMAVAGDVTFPPMTLDLASGKVVVKVSEIVQVAKKDIAAVQVSAFDFSGSYKISSAGITQPKGYVGACPPNSKSECKGPPENMPIWFKRVPGKAADGSPKYLIMAWQSEDAFKACGSKLGFTYADANTKAGIDLSASGVAEGTFTWDANFVDGWKYTNATSGNYTMYRMEKGTIGSYTGEKQFFSKYQTCTWNNGGQSCSEVSTPGYQFHVNNEETGCKVNGKPYQLHDWSNMESCTQAALTGGIQKNTCTKTIANVGTVTCVNINGTFKLDGTPIENGWPHWDNDPTKSDFDVLLAANAPCSGLGETTDAEKLAKLRCYSQGYDQAREANRTTNANACLRNVDLNWDATTPTDFVLSNNGPAKAENEFIMDLFEYDSPNSGSFRNEEIRYESFNQNGSWVNCRVQNTMTMSIRKLPDSNDLQVEMIEDTRNIDTKPACIAGAAADTDAFRSMKTMFKMIKQ